MAKIVNNRVYLECNINEIDSYSKEIHKVIGMGLDKYVIIWDQSEQEQKTTEDEIFDVYLNMNKINDDGIKIFDRKIWRTLVESNLYRAKFIQIGCWKSELGLIEEIKSVCKISGIEEYGDQIEFFMELNDTTREYIINRFQDANGNIKWFNLVLYSSSDKKSIIFSSSHFGEENYIFELNAQEVEKAIVAVENNDVYVRINRHQ